MVVAIYIYICIYILSVAMTTTMLGGLLYIYIRNANNQVGFRRYSYIIKTKSKSSHSRCQSRVIVGFKGESRVPQRWLWHVTKVVLLTISSDTCLRACVCVYVCLCVYIYICACVCVCLRVNAKP